MTEPRALLALGAPDVGPIPAVPSDAPRPFPPQPSRPSPGRQGQRLTPQFQALREALEAGRTAPSIETDEPDPELVAVFDLAGTVESFARAVRDVPGLEFLAEIQEEDAPPDDDFHIVRGGQRVDGLVSETLYMVMSNAQAVTELISLFERWKADATQRFATGLNPLRSAFAQLRSIRRWGPQDRVRETGLEDAWREDVAVVGSLGSVRVEIELWFRADTARRTAVQGQVAALIDRAGGRIVTSALVETIGYHGILADLPYPQVEAVLANGPEAIELLRTDTVMFVSPARPMNVPALEIADDVVEAGYPPAPTTRPRVAMLDGLPLANHAVLAGRLIIDDPDELASRYTSVVRQQHGTAMASLISHGDLNDPRPPLSTPIYVRPILEPHPLDGAAETVARDRLLVDLVHRAFHRMFEGDGTHGAAAPSVRIVNLSIGDPARAFARRMSPLAKLLDWLAYRYNLVILVSAGNHPITATVPAEAIDNADALTTALRKR